MGNILHLLVMPSLNDLYREVILDHYRSPRNRGELPTPPAIKSEGKNPVCGDELTLYVQVEDQKIKDAKIAGSGCSISMASASMMSKAIIGKSVEEARQLINTFKSMMDIHEKNLENKGENENKSGSSDLGELEALTGVVKFPVRIKCATLAFNTLSNALDASEGKEPDSVATTE